MTDAFCQKCGGGDILQIDDVTDQIGTHLVGLTQMALVCSGCGFVEFYARNIEAVRALAKQRQQKAPYR
jgi:hypothetical protein